MSSMAFHPSSISSWSLTSPAYIQLIAMISGAALMVGLQSLQSTSPQVRHVATPMGTATSSVTVTDAQQFSRAAHHNHHDASASELRPSQPSDRVVHHPARPTPTLEALRGLRDMSLAAVVFVATAWLTRHLSQRQAPPALAMATVTSTAEGRKLRQPIFQEQDDRIGVTLTRYMAEMARANPDMAELEPVLASIQTAGKAIARLIQRAPIEGILGKAGAVNVQGEEQKKLDVVTNTLLKQVLRESGHVDVLASEEEDEPVSVSNKANPLYGLAPEDEREGRFVTVFDPLDGSSNVDAGIPTGTIFGIFERDDTCKIPDNFFEEDATTEFRECLRQTLQPGKSLVAAGYILYSSSTFFVLSVGTGVNGFTLDSSLGEFILTHPQIQIPERGDIYSINSANRPTWDAAMHGFVDSLNTGTNEAGVKYTSRYIGSMVGDVHRTLMYGGVFMYPADGKNKNGKLRLLYEAAPMSYLVEQAGGRASTGVTRLLDIPPRSVHQRVPCVMGGKAEVKELEAWYARAAPPELVEAHQALLTPLE